MRPTRSAAFDRDAIASTVPASWDGEASAAPGGPSASDRLRD